MDIYPATAEIPPPPPPPQPKQQYQQYQQAHDERNAATAPSPPAKAELTNATKAKSFRPEGKALTSASGIPPSEDTEISPIAKPEVDSLPPPDINLPHQKLTKGLNIKEESLPSVRDAQGAIKSLDT